MLLLRDLFGARPALVAGLVLAAAPLHVATSRLVSPYPIAALGAMLLAWSCWRLLRGERRLWATALAGGLALYAGYPALTVLGAAVACAVGGMAAGRVKRESLLALVGAAAIAIVLFSPWGLYDLPTEPGGQFVPSMVDGKLVASLPQTPFEGAAGPLGAGVLGLALIGVVAAWRRRPLAGAYAGAVILIGVVSVLVTAHLGPYVFSPSQMLFVLPLYLGLAAFGVEWLIRWIPVRALWTPACLAVAGLFVWHYLPLAHAAAGSAAPREDWRAAFDVVQRNLRPDDLVAAPQAANAIQVYGIELERRLPRRDRVPVTFAWMARGDRSWLVAGLGAQLDPTWAGQWKRINDHGFLIDLSPAPAPSVFFFATRKKRGYVAACHFDLPAEVLARQTLLRDCLREIGPMLGPLRQVQTLIASPGVGLRNASLLESVTLLGRAGHPQEAGALADAIAAREPDLAGAARAALRAGETPPTS